MNVTVFIQGQMNKVLLDLETNLLNHVNLVRARVEGENQNF